MEPITANTINMSHCHDEHVGHSHDHGSDTGHDHSDDVTPATQFLLYNQIDFDAIITLNEVESRSGAAIAQKTWEQRLDPHPELESDADEQVLMTIP